MSTPKKTTGGDQTLLRQGTSRVDTPIQTNGLINDLAVTSPLEAPQGSSSSLNLNSWDGVIGDLFDDVSNNSMPFSQEVGSGTNHELSVTGDNRTFSVPSQSCGHAGHPIDVVVPEPVFGVGSEKKPDTSG